MNNPKSRLTSLELYLNYPAKSVVSVTTLEDVACGIYPCYYLIQDDYLLVSSSAISLIKYSQDFVFNPHFCPDLLKHNFYDQRNTIDKRITKLSPFEIRTASGSNNNFKPTRRIKDPAHFKDSSVQHFSNFILQIEKQFPEYEHIVLTGGKDSLLIHLGPKLNPEKWHIFSSEPNTKIVQKFFEQNQLQVNRFFGHDNIDDEDLLFVMQKVIDTDCTVNPAHYRWMKALQNIASEFKGKCIFWTGSIGDALNSYNTAYAELNYQQYFAKLAGRASQWQGMYHQLCFNLVGAPLLSIYHSAEIWQELYQHFDPALTYQQDHRMQLGEMLAAKPIIWPEENPGPKPWVLSNDILNLLLPFYTNYIQKQTKSL